MRDRVQLEKAEMQTCLERVIIILWVSLCDTQVLDLPCSRSLPTSQRSAGTLLLAAEV